MTVTYIHHSGFLVETETCYYLIDYFQGPIPELNPEKPIMVLASHKHHDHYQKSVFATLKDRGMEKIFAVLSRDIPARGRPEGVPCIQVSAGKGYKLPQGQELRTFRSTDLGVAFLIRDGQSLFYHAGDLNDWVWAEESEDYNHRMTAQYRRQIDLLARELDGRPLTAAFVVLDPRQERDYDRGMLYFLQNIPCDCVYPMHYWEQPGMIARFLREHPQYENRVMLTQPVDTIYEE